MPLTAIPTAVLDPSRIPLHLPRLTRLATRLSGSRDAGEDLVQDTLERVLRSPRAVGGDEFRYLARSLRNTHVDRLRAGRRRVRTTVLDEPLEAMLPAAGGTELIHQAHVVLAAVAALPEHYRDAVAAVDVAGLSYEDAARSLGVPVGTVMSRLYRGRARVVEGFEDVAVPAL